MPMAGGRPFGEYVENLLKPHRSFGDYYDILALIALYRACFFIVY